MTYFIRFLGDKMFKINDYVVYKSDVCQIVDIRNNSLNNQDYYVLRPIEDDSLKIDIPTDNRNNYLRGLLNVEEVHEIIADIPNIEIIKSTDKLMENEYRKLLNTYLHRDLIKIIKTTYIRNKERNDHQKKVSERDNNYFEKAEKRLYTEFGLVLNLDFNDTKKYIIDKVESLR